MRAGHLVVVVALLFPSRQGQCFQLRLGNPNSRQLTRSRHSKDSRHHHDERPLRSRGGFVVVMFPDLSVYGRGNSTGRLHTLQSSSSSNAAGESWRCAASIWSRGAEQSRELVASARWNSETPVEYRMIQYKHVLCPGEYFTTAVCSRCSL